MAEANDSAVLVGAEAADVVVDVAVDVDSVALPSSNPALGAWGLAWRVGCAT